ncbi:hypothetical protein ABZ341_42865 [Streptomyces sp. NPDC006173]|uniref:hypothetical protein n=1 Tax=Streptomyces sp. NPDC006173 TaxID=3155349 RepID=UPI0033C45B4D
MIRDLYNVRLRAEEDAPAPLTDGEEQRYRSMLFRELGDKIAEQGWVRFPAYTLEDRRRLVAVAHRLTAYWGQEVFIEAEDHMRVRLSLAGFRTLLASSAAQS